MTLPSDIIKAYHIGKEAAEAEYMHKEAFLGSVASAGKFLLGMGNLGQKGSTLARIS